MAWYFERTMNNNIPASDLPGAIAVTITNAGNNKYLTVPASGRMQIVEVFTDGSVMGAFQPGRYENGIFYADGGPVGLLRPKFISAT